MYDLNCRLKGILAGTYTSREQRTIATYGTVPCLLSRHAKNDISPLPVYLGMYICPLIYPNGGVQGGVAPPGKWGSGRRNPLENLKSQVLCLNDIS